MVKFKVDVSEPAEADLRDIVRHISMELYAPVTALNMMEAIDKALSSLSEVPCRRPLVRDDRLASIGYRQLTAKNYIVFFSVNEKDRVVDVERILYGQRDWANIL